jgi:diketogulonate reductase-like aldo/keto reductase
LDYREFGWTGDKVSVIGMGTYYDPVFIATAMLLRHQNSRDSKIAALEKGLDLGINLIDTAEVYQTENLVAEAIVGHKRENLFIATKVSAHHLRYNSVLKAAENSLRRLRLSYIDLYQIHFPNPAVPVEDTMKAMEKLVEYGRIRHIGVSNFSLEQMKRAEDALSSSRLASNQVEYNLRARSVEDSIVQHCEETRIAVLPYRPVAHGVLTSPGGTLQTVMEEISRKHGGKTPAQIALNWLISKSGLNFPIPRASRPQRVIEDVGAAGWTLDSEDMRSLEEAAKKS